VARYVLPDLHGVRWCLWCRSCATITRWHHVIVRRLHEHAAATNIQRVWRGHRARAYIKFMCAQRIQTLVRAALARIHLRQIKLEMEEAEAARRREEEAFVQAEGDKVVDEVSERLEQKKNPAVKKEVKEEVKAVKAHRKRQQAARKKMLKAELKIEEIRDTFEMFDLDGSGAIDLDELRLCMKELCVPMTTEELQVRLAVLCERGGCHTGSGSR